MRKYQNHPCIVVGCPRSGMNQIGVRCRVAHDGQTPVPGKKRTNAIFSVETDAYLCDAHALAGGTLTMMFEPNYTTDITVEVLGEVDSVRTNHIKQPEEVAA